MPRCRSLNFRDGEERQVSQGMWFWHPGKQRVPVQVTAIDMVPEFFQYVTRFDGAVMLSDVVIYSRDGAPQRYEERWEPLHDDRSRWSLIEVTDEGDREAYDAVYTGR